MDEPGGVLTGGGAYVVDSDIWIDMWNLYPPDVFPTVWRRIEELTADGKLVSPDIVADELARVVDDPILRHLKSLPGLFRPLDLPLQLATAGLLSTMPGFAEPDADRTKADPFVVALAVLITGVVVTKENPSRSTDRIKIPDACAKAGVRSIKFLDFLRELGIKL